MYCPILVPGGNIFQFSPLPNVHCPMPNVQWWGCFAIYAVYWASPGASGRNSSPWLLSDPCFIFLSSVLLQVSEWPLGNTPLVCWFLSKQLSLLPLCFLSDVPLTSSPHNSAPGRSSGQPRQIYLWLTIGIIRLTRSSLKKLSTPSLFTEEPGPGPRKKVN